MWKLLRFFLLALSIIAVAILSASVFRSGAYYLYNIDELAHTQITYLLLSGVHPYTSFHMIFTPVFYWFQMPLYIINGFNFSSIQIMRYGMIGLFILRIAITFLFIKRIFTKSVAFLFIPLLLLDPFSTFSAMQIRPDNLMIAFFTLGLLVFSYSNKSLRLTFLAGFLMSLSVLTLIKILPGLVIFIWIFSVFCFFKKSWKPFFIFLLGAILPWGLIFLYFLGQGNLTEYLRNTIIFAFLNNISALHSFPLSFFYSRERIEIFGTAFLRLPWIYSVCLPFFSLVGVYICSRSRPTLMQIQCIGLFFMYWLWVLVVPGVYLQYFLPLTWLCALFTSFFLIKTLSGIKNKSKKLFRVIITTLSIGFLLLVKESVETNIYRSQISGAENIQYFKTIWKIVPPDQSTFPNTLFRPLGYPLTYGTFIGDLPPYILNHWGKVEESLEKKKVTYVFKTNFLWKYLDSSTKKYIEENYHESTISGILKRNTLKKN